jgi:hypothetical protein
VFYFREETTDPEENLLFSLALVLLSTEWEFGCQILPHNQTLFKQQPEG